MRRVAAKFVLRILTTEQKEWRLSVATNMLQEAESDENFMGQVMAFLSFSNHPTPLTWVRVTFGCSPN